MPQFGRVPVPVPRQQFSQPVDRMSLGHAVDHIGEVSLGVEAVELGALQHGVEGRGALAARLRAEEQEVLAGDRDATQRAFGDIVVDRQPSVAGIAHQRLPAAQGILDRSGQRVLRRQPPALSRQPIAQ
jgi:hypothetical protein